MQLTPVLRYSPHERMVRLARLVWERGTVGDGNGYSAKLTVALWPSLFHFRRDLYGWRLTLLGVRVHFMKAFGGRFG